MSNNKSEVKYDILNFKNNSTKTLRVPIPKSYYLQNLAKEGTISIDYETAKELTTKEDWIKYLQKNMES